MAGIDNDVFFGTNVDFRGVEPVTGQMIADGQLLIGAAVAPYIRVNNLTASSGISITNGAGSITLSTSGGGIAWVDVTGATQTIAINTGYFSNNAVTVAFTLPATATKGDVFRIVGVQGSWTIAQNANQQIKFGNVNTTLGIGGSLASTNLGDCIELVALTTGASTIWRVISSIGNITIV